MTTAMTTDFFKGQKVALVQCGSFNPPHFLHMMMLEDARERVRAAGAEVVEGIVSPVSDAYGKAGLLSGAHRLAMCRAAVRGSDWLRVSDLEVRSAAYLRTRTVLDRYRAELRERHRADVRPVLVCGADLVESLTVPGCWAEDDVRAILADYGLVAIERVGLDVGALVRGAPLLAPYADHILATPPAMHNNLSSTLIRSRVRDGHYVKYMLDDAVIDYINQHNLYRADQP